MCAYQEVHQSLSHPCKLMHSHPGHECWEKNERAAIELGQSSGCCLLLLLRGTNRLEPSNTNLKKLAGVLETLRRTELC